MATSLLPDIMGTAPSGRSDGLGPAQEADRERSILALRLASPKRSTAEQHDTSELALFQHANEPRLL
jgi:hypothetical protein